MAAVLGEFDIIARYFASHGRRARCAARRRRRCCACSKRRADRRLVVAIDTIVEGVHFPRQHRRECGRVSRARRESQRLAAMGAEPAWAMLSLSLPAATSLDRRLRFGLSSWREQYDVALVGGDTVRGPLSSRCSSPAGSSRTRWRRAAERGRATWCWCPACPGEAAAGLARDPATACRRTKPRAQSAMRDSCARSRASRWAVQLRGIASRQRWTSPTVCSVDLQKLCAASHCGALLEHRCACRNRRALQELLDAESRARLRARGRRRLRAAVHLAFRQAARSCWRNAIRQCRSHSIGVIVAGSGVQCERNGAAFVPRRSGYDHFAVAGSP